MFRITCCTLAEKLRTLSRMEILPGVHQLPLTYKGRRLNLYLLQFGGESMLMDTGFASTPAQDIEPYFQSIGFDPKRLSYVMLTHPDLDHVGGVYAMRDLAPQAKFICGEADREQIETPEGLGRIRARAHYHFHGLGPDDAKLATFIENAGGPGKRLALARTFDRETIFQLGDREITILHLPGHSMGHLGVYLPGAKTAIIADAVHGTANRFIDGKAAFACTYMYVDAYLGTITQLRAMGLDRLYSCHWPDCLDAAAVNGFLDESRDYAVAADESILSAVQAAGTQGATLKDVCMQAKTKLGDWPAERDLDARSMVCGHLQRLAALGVVRSTEDIPTRYIIEPAWRGLR